MGGECIDGECFYDPNEQPGAAQQQPSKQERKRLKKARKQAKTKGECDAAKGEWVNEKDCLHPSDKRVTDAFMQDAVIDENDNSGVETSVGRINPDGNITLNYDPSMASESVGESKSRDLADADLFDDIFSDDMKTKYEKLYNSATTAEERTAVIEKMQKDIFGQVNARVEEVLNLSEPIPLKEKKEKLKKV